MKLWDPCEMDFPAKVKGEDCWEEKWPPRLASAVVGTGQGERTRPEANFDVEQISKRRKLRHF